MTSSQSLDHQARSWFSDRLQGLSPERVRAFEDWIGQSQAHREAYLRHERLWDELGWDETLNAEALDLDTAAEAARMTTGAVSWRARLFALVERFEGYLAAGAAAGIAAAALLVLVWPGLTQPAPQTPELQLEASLTYATDVGEIRTFALEDGTEVTLGGATEIEVRFAADRRDVRLVAGGDALFDVARDENRPFRVDAGRVTATVLGTVFEINSAHRAAAVSVLEGRVRVSDARRYRDLSAGERVVAQAGRGWDHEEFDASSAARWIETRLVFRDAPLGRIVEDINRYYPQGVQLETEALASLRVTSSFRIDQLEGALSGIALSHGLRVEGSTPEGFILLSENSSE